jgi:hypothetical protein
MMVKCKTQALTTGEQGKLARSLVYKLFRGLYLYKFYLRFIYFSAERYSYADHLNFTIDATIAGTYVYICTFILIGIEILARVNSNIVYNICSDVLYLI